MSKIDPIKSLHDFVLDVKPYHTKVLDVFVDYRHDEPVNVGVTDSMNMTVDIDQISTDFVCEVAGFEAEPFDSGWESILEMSLTPVVEVNAPGLYFAIGGNYLGYFATKMVESLPGAYQISVSDPSQSYTVTDVSFDVATFRTRIFVSQSLGAMTGGKVLVPQNSNWDYPDRCIDPATGVRVATPLRVVAHITEEFEISDSDVSLTELVAVGRFQCDTAVGWGGNAGLLRRVVTAVNTTDLFFDIKGNATLFFATHPTIVMNNPNMTFTNNPAKTIYDSITDTTHVYVINSGSASTNMNALALNYNDAYVVIETYSPFDDDSFEKLRNVWDGPCGYDWLGSSTATETLFKETLQISAQDGDATTVTGSWDGNQWDMTLFNGNAKDFLPPAQQF